MTGPSRRPLLHGLALAALLGVFAAIPEQSYAQAGKAGRASEPAAVLQEVFAATMRGDIAALDTLFAGDSLMIVEGAGINRGWADYRDHHLVPELKGMRLTAYAPREMEVHVTGAVAWIAFAYSLRADVSGRAVDNVGRGTAILEFRDARWRVRHLQTAGRARRPMDPPVS